MDSVRNRPAGLSCCHRRVARAIIPTVTDACFDATVRLKVTSLTVMADTFVATGLLGSGPSASLLGSSSTTDGLSSVFLSNGLLGGLCIAPTPSHAQPEERAQELKGIDEPQSSRNTVSLSSRSFIPTHIRAPLRATTYDGNAIHIRRKPYVGTTQKARYQCIPFLFYAYRVQISSAPTRLSNLLDVPIHRLRDELSAATASKLSFSCVSFDSI